MTIMEFQVCPTHTHTYARTHARTHTHTHKQTHTFNSHIGNWQWRRCVLYVSFCMSAV